MSEPSTKPDLDNDVKRQREAVDKLLARTPVAGTGQVTLASGKRLDYELNATFMPVTLGGIDAQRGEPQAAVFCIAYTVPSDKPRPLCFAFNGGPGSASGTSTRRRPSARFIDTVRGGSAPASWRAAGPLISKWPSASVTFSATPSPDSNWARVSSSGSVTSRRGCARAAVHRHCRPSIVPSRRADRRCCRHADVSAGVQRVHRRSVQARFN